MFSMHECPEGKSIFECPFEEHQMPRLDACNGCQYLREGEVNGDEVPCCAATEGDGSGSIVPLQDLDECPEGNTPEYCSYGEECRVGDPITIDDMLKLNE